VRRSPVGEGSAGSESTGTPGGDTPTASAGQGLSEAPIQPPLARQFVSPRATIPSAASDNDGKPPVRVVNTLTFALEYDPGTTPAAADEQAEFWATRDGGRTWLSHGTDSDRRSPMLITVHEEGVYGFRIVVRRNSSGASEPPPSGSMPDLWVVVRGSPVAPTNGAATSAKILDARPAR
jgi:hypothetical protein